MKILVIKLREIGDTVFLTSSLLSLREKYPSAKIDVLTLSSNEAILLRLTEIDGLFLVKKRSGFKFLAMLFSLRFRSYDLALGFHASSSLCSFIRLAGAKENILHHHGRTETPQKSDRQLVNPGFLQNAILRDYEILKTLGINCDPHPTKISVANAEKQWAIDRLCGTGVTSSTGILALLPGASSHEKRYSLESWVKLIRILNKKGVTAIVLVDRSLSLEWGLRVICAEENIPLIDDVSLRQFISLISVCRKVVAMDSSPLHIAVALGLKTYSLFGPSCIGDWHPYNKEEQEVFRLPVTCRDEGPQGKDEFQYCSVQHCSHNSCMKHDPLAVAEKMLCSLPAMS